MCAIELINGGDELEEGGGGDDDDAMYPGVEHHHFQVFVTCVTRPPRYLYAIVLLVLVVFVCRQSRTRLLQME